MEEIEMRAPPINLDEVDEMDDIDIERFADNRGYNLQLIAAESGHSHAIKSLINRGFDVDAEVDGHTAVELAFANKHFEVVLDLLKANSRFPTNYDSEVAPDNLKEFALISEELHECIRNENEEKMEEIFKCHPSLRHFYNLENKSAVQVALESKKLHVYKKLISYNVYMGPHEDIDVTITTLSRQERRLLREIHASMSSSVISNGKPMLTLAKNSFIGPDIPNQIENLNFITHAYHFLFQIPLVAIILRIVAAARKFKIIYDFKRDSVSYLDPSAEPYTNGMFYTSRKVFIAAKNLLDPDRRLEVYSVIAHELCHFAMFLVYENSAKPYLNNDEKGRIAFDKAIELCKMSYYDLTKLMFSCYPPTMYPAELIVRAPQMLVLHHFDEEILTERKEEFKPLFDFYGNCAIEMEKALPKIKAKNLSKNQKKILRQRKIIIGLSVLLGIFILTMIPLLIFFYSPDYSWNNLNQDEKLNLQNSIVKYHGVEVKFCELFANDSIVYEKLSSNEIKEALNGKSLILSQNIESLYEPYIYITWANMTKQLRENFISLNVTFQGQSVKFEKILPTRHSVLRLLSFSQIKQQFNGDPIKISSSLKTKIKFFVDRLFVNEFARVPEQEENLNFEVFLNFENITEEISSTKAFLISCFAGEGKSTTYKHFWYKLKEKFPSKWVEYVDLKKYTEAYKVGNKSDLTNSHKISSFLSDHLLRLNELEKGIFTERFSSGNVIFLWDGIDEVSPFFTDFMLYLVVNYKSFTNNSQFISTRPQHSENYRKALAINSYKLVPLIRKERISFLIKCIAIEMLNIDPRKFPEHFYKNFTKVFKSYANNTEEEILEFDKTAQRGLKVLNTIENTTNSNDFATNPLLIKMIAEIVTDEEISIEENLNFYKLYEIFIKKKIMEVDNKGTLIKSRKAELEARAVNIMELHIGYVWKLSLHDFEYFYHLNISNVKLIKSVSKISIDDINRYGILNIISDTDYDFIHRTFLEYLFAQYLINHLDDVHGTDTDSKFNLMMLQFMWTSVGTEEVTRKFIESYINHEEYLSPALQFLKDDLNFENGLKEEITNNSKILFMLKFVNSVEFFERNCEVPIDQNPYSRDLFGAHFWRQKDLNEFVEKWEKIKNYLGDDKFIKIFKIRNNLNGSVLNDFSMTATLTNDFFIKMNETFDRSEILQLLALKDVENLNVLMRTAEFQKFEIFWETLKNFSSLEERKELLMITGKFNYTVLHFSMKSSEIFLFVKNIYEEFFTRDYIRKIIIETESERTLLLMQIIDTQNLKLCEEVAEYLTELFFEYKRDLRGFLSRRSRNGDTIYSFFTAGSGFDHYIEVFTDLLNFTFENEAENFSEYLLVIKKSLGIEIYFKKSDDFKLRGWHLNWNDFEYIIQNWESIKSMIRSENFKEFLFSKTHEESDFPNKTIIFDLFSNADPPLVEQFLEKITKFLNEEDIKELLSSDMDILKDLVKDQKVELIQMFWDFCKKYLDNEQMKDFLLCENNIYDNALRESTKNEKHSKTFLFVKKLYEENFSKTEIKKMFVKKRDDYNFMFSMVYLDNDETFEELSKYLLELFADEKQKLKKILDINAQDFETKDKASRKYQIFKNLYDSVTDSNEIISE